MKDVKILMNYFFVFIEVNIALGFKTFSVPDERISCKVFHKDNSSAERVLVSENLSHKKPITA